MEQVQGSRKTKQLTSPEGKKPVMKRQQLTSTTGEEVLDRSAQQYMLAAEFMQLRRSMGGIGERARKFLSHWKHRRIQLVEKVGFAVDESGGKGIWTHNYKAITTVIQELFWAQVQPTQTVAGPLASIGNLPPPPATKSRPSSMLLSLRQQPLAPPPAPSFAPPAPVTYVPPRSGKKPGRTPSGLFPLPVSLKPGAADEPKVHHQFSGDIHGKIVHNQLSWFINNYSRVELDSDTLIFPEADPCTLEVLMFLFNRRLLPIASELSVWDETTHIAGAIDLIVQTDNDEIWLMELKNGYEDNNYEPTDRDPWMRPPFEDLKDCHKHRHLVQLLLQSLLLYNGYEQFRPDASHILRSLQREQTVKLDMLDAKWASAKFARVTAALKEMQAKQHAEFGKDLFVYKPNYPVSDAETARQLRELSLRNT